MKKKFVRRQPPAVLLSFGFAALILLGSLLLMLPISNRDGQYMPFLNALFEATSATCVTGLTVYDPYTQFTLFGQIVLLILIQIGGLGFVTVIFLFLLSRRKKIGLNQRSLLMESVSALQLDGIVPLVKLILGGSLFLELAGALLFSIRFVPLFGWKQGLWFSLFHAVSSFCNAGFDLLGAREAPSLNSFQNDPLVLLTAAFLVLLGGLGFVVWSDLLHKRFQWKKLELHTQIVLTTTMLLIVIPLFFYIMSEQNASLAGMTPLDSMVNAFFLTVTPRTAGFSNVDLSTLSPAGKLMMMALMIAGAAPGGTGGGLKITTLVLIGMTVWEWLHSTETVDTPIGRYRIDHLVVRRAFVTASLYILLAVLGSYILCLCGEGVEESLFECISAVGTVGVTLGITPTLNDISKLTVIALMFIGRLGGMTVFLALSRPSASEKVKNPVGKLIIG